MRLKQWIGIFSAALIASQSTTFAYQKVDVPFTKPQTKEEQLAKVEFISPDELKSKIAKNETVTVVDLRGPSVYAQSDKTIQGAIHTKVRRVTYRLKAVSHDSEVITYCACPADQAAIIAARTLLANGFKRVRVLKGGWNAWLQADGQLRPRPR